MDQTRTAALSLHYELHQRPWYVTTGITENQGENCLIVYVSPQRSSNAKPKVPETYMGFKVLTKTMSAPQPA